MSTAANSSSASIHQAQNSPRSGRQSRKSSAAARGSDISPPSPPILGIADQEQLLVSSSNTGFDSIPAKEANTMVASDDGGFCGDDVELDTSDGGGAAKKPAWNMPSSGSTVEVAGVMSGESWPLLSESARAPPRSPSTYSLKPLPHTVSQDLTEVSLSSSKEVISTISAPNTPTRHKSMKRGVGSSTHNSIAANDNSSIAPTLQQGSAVDNAHNAGKNGASGDTSNKDGHKDGVQRGGTYTGHEQQPQRPYRRSNSGPISRGDGSQYGNHRRDHGKQDWGNRSFGSRESQGHRVGSRPFIRGPAAPNASFIPPPPIRPFVAPIVYPEMPSPVFYVPGHHPDSLRSVPMVPIQSMFYPMPDPHLPTKIVNQIDYYFSSENLVKDTFLRQNMDAEGWVSIKLIAGFKKVMQLTDNVQLLLDAIKASNIVEVQGEKVRRKNDWNKWVMSPIHATSPQSMGRTSQSMLSAQFNSIVLDEKAAT